MKKPPSRPHSDENINLAFNRALRFLTIRIRSIKEIKDYLIKKGFVDKTIDATINRLLELKFLNDEEFGAQWIESRQKHKGKSKFVLKTELKQKGLSDELIEKLLEQTQSDLETAKDFFDRKKNRLSHLSKEEFEKKIIGMLQHKGFSWNTISKVLKQD